MIIIIITAILSFLAIDYIDDKKEAEKAKMYEIINANDEKEN